MLPVFQRHPRRGPHAALLWRGWLHVGNHRQIELNLHLGFGLTLVCVTWLLAEGLLPRLFAGWQPSAYWFVALTLAISDGLAGLLHELGHAGMAMARGRRVSRITLYGLSAVARRSGGTLRTRDHVLIAVAGPLSHLLLAGTLWIAWINVPTDNEPLRVAAGFPALSNLLAGVLNLLPVAPLDGGRAARAVLAGFFRA